MSFEIIKEFNEATRLICIDNSSYRVVKEISEIDFKIYDKLRNIKNNYLARVYDIVRNGERLYAVLEYVQGETIEQYIEKNGLFEPEKAKRIIAEICYGLDELHRNNIIHRDINPSNIIINGEDIKIIDYDISRLEKLGKGRDTEILGTIGYAAPEQFGFEQTNSRTDIYSVGVLLNYMLTGKLPYEKMAQGEFAPIIKKCTQLDESKRYRSAIQLGYALNKRGISYFFSNLPGFRTNNVFKKIIASVYYTAVIFLFVWTVDYHNFKTAIQDIMIYSFLLIFPVLLLFNMFYWSDRLMKNAGKQNRLIVRIIATIISIFIAFILPSIFIQ